MSETSVPVPDSKEPILAPEEINALLEAMAPGEEAEAMFSTLPPIQQPKHVEDFSFENTDHNGPERYPLFATLQQRFTEALKELWAETFQREVVIEQKGISQRLYQDILKDDEEKPQVYFMYDVKGYGRMALASELSLVVAYIDAMLGGLGESFNSSDVLSPVEDKLAKRFSVALEKLLAHMWSPVSAMQFVYQKTETEAQFLGLAGASDMCFSAQFELELSEDFKGYLNLHFPRSFLEPVLDKLRTSASDESGVIDPDWDNRLQKSLAQVPLNTQLEFGQCHLDIQQFLSLRAGDFLPLSKPEHDPATLLIGSAPIFEAMPGSQDGQLAVELLKPLVKHG